MTAYHSVHSVSLFLNEQYTGIQLKRIISYSWMTQV